MAGKAIGLISALLVLVIAAIAVNADSNDSDDEPTVASAFGELFLKLVSCCKILSSLIMAERVRGYQCVR